MKKNNNRKFSLITQSCIKGLLVVRDFCFWAIWAAGPVHKKIGVDYEQLYRAVFLMFLGSKESSNFFENTIASALKSCAINFDYSYSYFHFFCFILGLHTFSNVNLLHKSLLLQDWVFRMGLPLK